MGIGRTSFENVGLLQLSDGAINLDEQHFINFHGDRLGVGQRPVLLIGWYQRAAVVLDTAPFLVLGDGFLVGDRFEFDGGTTCQLSA